MENTTENCYSIYYKMLFINREKRLYNFLKKNWYSEYYPIIPSNFLLDHIHQDWNFWKLSREPYLDLTIVEKYPEKNWDFGFFCDNVNFNWNFFRKFIERNWSFKNILKRIDFPLELLEYIPSNVAFPECIQEKRNIPLPILVKLSNRWNYCKLSRNEFIPLIFIEKTIKCSWDFRGLSVSNRNISPEFVMRHWTYDWNLYYICFIHPAYMNELIEFFNEKKGFKFLDQERLQKISHQDLTSL